MTRRAKGEGTYRRIKGRIYPIVEGNKENGKRKRFSIGSFATLAEAKKAVQDFKNRHGMSPLANQKISEWLRSWLKRFVKTKSATTIASYRTQIEKNIIPEIGDVKICDLEARHIDKLFCRLATRLNSNSINTIGRILSAAINRAVLDDVITKNVVKSAHKPRVEPKDYKMIQHEKAYQLFQKILSEPVYRLTLLFGLCEGLRPGEALGLKWSDIDLTRRTVAVKRQIVMSCGCIEIKELKTIKSYRTLALPDVLLRELRKTPARQRKGFILSKEARNPNKLRRHFRKICLGLGISGLTPHGLRHLNATYLLEARIPIQAVSAHLGHTSTKTTGDIYAHELPAMEIEAANAIEKAIAAPKAKLTNPSSPMGPSQGKSR